MHISLLVHGTYNGRMRETMSGISLTQNVYDRLRADLLACRLVPGQKLKINDLCDRFEAGTSAVREALSRLASEGFITAEPQRGFRVTPLSLDELRDLTDTRCQIEALCLRSAITHGGLEWETHVIASLHRLSKTPVSAPGDPKRYNDAFANAHTTFHEALVGACASPWLLRLRATLYVQQARYRWLSRPLAKVERDLDSEHAEIAAATLARDADRAVELLSKHFQLTAQIILESADEGLIAMNAPAPKARLREGAAGTLSTSS